MDIAFQ